jgi:uncharacterized phage-associated protein
VEHLCPTQSHFAPITSGEAVADVRAIANLVLSRAAELRLSVSNMALNKIVYFVHCDYLVERGSPLVRAKIEAWKHGPVFREIYHQFKQWDDNPIQGRATKVDPQTGEVVLADEHFSDAEKRYLSELIDRYVRFSAPQLRAISHVAGGPWHVVWGHDGESNPGMQITNQLILDHYSSVERQ